MLRRASASALIAGMALLAGAPMATAQSMIAWGGTDPAPVLPIGVDPVEVSAGGYHTLVRLSDGRVLSWGSCLDQQCNVPPAPPGTEVVEIAAGLYHSLLRFSDGSIVAWGRNVEGQCNVPPLPPGVTYVDIAAGGFHSAALRSDRQIVCFGLTIANVPPLPPGVGYVDVECGHAFTAARRSDGSVIGWGSNAWGQLDVPALPAGVTWVEISTGGDHVVGRSSDGATHAWGNNGSGQCNVPGLPPGERFVQVSAGYAHTAGLASDGSVLAWGYNEYGQCNVPAFPPGATCFFVEAGGILEGGWTVALLAYPRGMTRLASRSSSGEPADAVVFEPSISADGRYVAFHGYATNLVQGDTNGALDVFVHDGLTGATVLASKSTAGVQGDGDSEHGRLSADGRHVAFVSTSSNLVPGIPGGIFVHDLDGGTTTCESLDPLGNPANDETYEPTLSGDGRYVCFSSLASNLVGNDMNGVADVFVRDRVTGVTTRVSVDSQGLEANGDSDYGRISADGRWVVFRSGADNLVPGDIGSYYDVFVHDRQTGETTRVSVSSAGIGGNADSAPGSFSEDLRLVSFESDADDLVTGDTNGQRDVFVRDRSLGTTVRVSVDSAGHQASGWSSESRVSADGACVVFSSTASDLVAGDENGFPDIFVHDLALGHTTLCSVASSGAQANDECFEPAVSGDGRCVAFTTLATDLLPGPSGFDARIVVRDRSGCAPTVASYCTTGTTSSGCHPTLHATGTPSASMGSGFTLSASSVEGKKSGIFFYGLSGPAALPWNGSTSTFCLRTPVRRMAALSSGGTPGTCEGELVMDWNEYVASHPGALGTPFVGGEVVWVQGWFRDPPTPGGSSLTDGLWFEVCP
jgi:Tol biopolymer transport system component